MLVQDQFNDLEECCTLFRFALVFSYWIFLIKVFNKATVFEWRTSKESVMSYGSWVDAHLR